jgi:aspartyl aminopeptidase
MMDNRVTALMSFLDNSPSVFHAVANLETELKNAGYTRLMENETWQLTPGGNYYLIRGGSAIVAFRIPEAAPKGFMISASHSDRPTFKVKENPELCGAYTRLAVERYGGMLMGPWLDRPLSVAGRCVVETEEGVENRLVNIDRDLLMMPNVAIHMNRAANDGYKWNPGVDTIPLLGSKSVKGKFSELLAEAAGGKVLGHDLFLYIRQKAAVWGMDEEYLSAQALDDLACAWCCAQGFLNSTPGESIPVLCVFDNEEVGSSSLQGAASNLLETAIHRLCAALNLDERILLSNSFLVSADNGHALHPNHPEFADPNNAPVVGGGVTLKFNANQRYCTDGTSAAVFRRICEKAQMPVQTYCNRADIAGGSTLGNISLSQVAVPSVDIGLPQLAMHSCYETVGVADVIALQQVMTVFYGACLTASFNGFVLK